MSRTPPIYDHADDENHGSNPRGTIADTAAAMMTRNLFRSRNRVTDEEADDMTIAIPLEEPGSSLELRQGRQTVMPSIYVPALYGDQVQSHIRSGDSTGLRAAIEEQEEGVIEAIRSLNLDSHPQSGDPLSATDRDLIARHTSDEESHIGLAIDELEESDTPTRTSIDNFGEPHDDRDRVGEDWHSIIPGDYKPSYHGSYSDLPPICLCLHTQAHTRNITIRNPSMNSDGVFASQAEARTYPDDKIGQAGPSSTQSLGGYTDNFQPTTTEGTTNTATAIPEVDDDDEDEDRNNADLKGMDGCYP
ncbi:uncharacterized protein I303_102431 [Kwoniella dejecticola CBS 10117]|uniref:Uncharacterized protein n=1 Tax=Kwoniella dejecticola CBS 10117 TaxID=1296121 RepID=A0A1A6A8Q4_9TREE|nr:uncharacterized protein I303_02446 [Kwoniella dejecticola CBS 10117]OBR86439.1 hypothetical protein I303_02446 [Kwoniella dejecticola CBS 10117]